MTSPFSATFLTSVALSSHVEAVSQRFSRATSRRCAKASLATSRRCTKDLISVAVQAPKGGLSCADATLLQLGGLYNKPLDSELGLVVC